MFSVLSYCSYILLVFKFFCVAEETDANKRYILDEDFKPAIFGSNKFNPVLQVFEDVNEDITTHTDQNVTILKVTEMGIDVTTPIENAKRALFRKPITLNSKPALWWTRARTRLSNVTKTVPIPKPNNLINPGTQKTLTVSTVKGRVHI